jgi:thioredoxin 1
MKPIRALRSVLFSFICLAVLTAGLRAADSTATADSQGALPRLVDLGAGKCIPCKQMKPILDELKRDYPDQFETVFIDVWENREEGPKYGIRIIPTQIFFDASGKERFRHEGFMAKKDILAKWHELGVEVKEPAAAEKR